MLVRRLVGWWPFVAVVAAAPEALAQSTASFPADTPAAPPPPAPPPPRPPAPPPARTAPVAVPAPPPARPSPAPARPAPQPAAAPAALPYTPPASSAYVSNAHGASTDTRPPVLPYYQGMPVPPGYEVVTKPASGLITAGVVGMSISYGGAVIVAATQGFENATGWLALPIAGPWIAIATRDYEQCKTSTVQQARRCVSEAVGEVQYITFVAVDGVFQIASALVMLAGAVSSKDELIRQDLVPRVSVAPGRSGGIDWAVTVQGNL